jgi:hypothetical protein
VDQGSVEGSGQFATEPTEPEGPVPEPRADGGSDVARVNVLSSRPAQAAGSISSMIRGTRTRGNGTVVAPTGTCTGRARRVVRDRDSLARRHAPTLTVPVRHPQPIHLRTRTCEQLARVSRRRLTFRIRRPRAQPWQDAHRTHRHGRMDDFDPDRLDADAVRRLAPDPPIRTMCPGGGSPRDTDQLINDDDIARAPFPRIRRHGPVLAGQGIPRLRPAQQRLAHQHDC